MGLVFVRLCRCPVGLNQPVQNRVILERDREETGLEENPIAWMAAMSDMSIGPRRATEAADRIRPCRSALQIGRRERAKGRHEGTAAGRAYHTMYHLADVLIRPGVEQRQALRGLYSNRKAGLSHAHTP
jgi:hypothetical protein